MTEIAPTILDTFRSGNAKVELSPEQLSGLAERLVYALTVADSVLELSLTAAAFTQTANKVNELLPNIFPAQPAESAEIEGAWPSAVPLLHEKGSQEPAKFNLTHLESIAEAVKEARSVGDEEGVIRAYRIAEFVPEANTLDADVTLPYGRATRGLWIDAVSTVGHKAVIGGVSDERTDGRPCPYIQFAAVIDPRKPKQRVKAYYGEVDEAESEPLFEAVIATLPKPDN